MLPAPWHLAQVNIGRIAAPLDSDTMHGFTSRLDEINALADGWPGFVWRLQGEEDSATDLRPFEDDTLLVNMSVWESLDALRDYVYRSDHVAVLRERRQYFLPMKEAFTALWWVPAGHLPTTDEAWQRLLHLREHGPTAHAFTFRQPFGPLTPE
ncbi:heme-degrading monooxygenase HmoA [Deinococcus metalli]|uniref:Heme-degrading monooxygenase HmoA n=1 Tax=Deinococcus metalli TaxID=1141878 RepID=A0A7W8KFP2_9DEIO|nr:DUF3291 domain-containing protein [Deinococcus metalli]MBB5377352.1 heme-degrading monooxygenase HmoA [Deinococcus metalli]GHF49818.1 hypothetical protein GCM10017781_27780 [Deinococcus metalli]